jgi:hypothetical protein
MPYWVDAIGWRRLRAARDRPRVGVAMARLRAHPDRRCRGRRAESGMGF